MISWRVRISNGLKAKQGRIASMLLSPRSMDGSLSEFMMGLTAQMRRIIFCPIYTLPYRKSLKVCCGMMTSLSLLKFLPLLLPLFTLKERVVIRLQVLIQDWKMWCQVVTLK
uniref:Uncharacterized protein n=1 Tax=Rhizophora mucronata TaxID=61149 RepID=A0A2P2MTH4_RHIMU